MKTEKDWLEGIFWMLVLLIVISLIVIFSFCVGLLKDVDETENMLQSYIEQTEGLQWNDDTQEFDLRED